MTCPLSPIISMATKTARLCLKLVPTKEARPSSTQLVRRSGSRMGEGLCCQRPCPHGGAGAAAGAQRHHLRRRVHCGCTCRGLTKRIPPEPPPCQAASFSGVAKLASLILWDSETCFALPQFRFSVCRNELRHSSATQQNTEAETGMRGLPAPRLRARIEILDHQPPRQDHD
jgi:hypothetical protein